jgi:hypothetical protein
MNLTSLLSGSGRFVQLRVELDSLNGRSSSAFPDAKRQSRRWPRAIGDSRLVFGSFCDVNRRLGMASDRPSMYRIRGWRSLFMSAYGLEFVGVVEWRQLIPSLINWSASDSSWLRRRESEKGGSKALLTRQHEH